jgi:hypothetical protein
MDFMAKPHDDKLEQAKRIMGALVRMPHKPHDQMKLGKKRGSAEAKPHPSSRKKNDNRSKPK